jgi:RimJ/RimL family protein N-acetyltransferase
MPLPEIRTSRVLLRPWTRDDVDALHALWARPEVRRYLWDDRIISRETAAEVVESHFDTQARLGIGYWALHIPPTEPSLAGFCGFRPIDEGPDVELMYGLSGDHWGRGLIAAACAAAIEHLWRSTAYPHVYARTDPPNEKSVAVMRRLGMTNVSTTPAMITYILRRPAGR